MTKELLILCQRFHGSFWEVDSCFSRSTQQKIVAGVKAGERQGPQESFVNLEQHWLGTSVVFFFFCVCLNKAGEIREKWFILLPEQYEFSEFRGL